MAVLRQHSYAHAKQRQVVIVESIRRCRRISGLGVLRLCSKQLCTGGKGGGHVMRELHRLHRRLRCVAWHQPIELDAHLVRAPHWGMWHC